MKVAVVLCLVIAAAQAGLVSVGPAALVRTPSLDSAVIKSDRIGGNFAYSTVEGHAYAAVAPVVQHVPTPVAVSYAAHPIALPLAHAGLPLAHAAFPYAHHGLIGAHAPAVVVA